MIGKFGRRWNTYRQRGLTRSPRGELETIPLSMLRMLFRFDRWHAQSSTSLRPYRIGLTAMVNGMQRRCVIEAGCGLGAILPGSASLSIEYDLHCGAIRAARLLRYRAMKFRTGSFEDVQESSIDLRIAVNWRHDLPAEQLERWLGPLLLRTRYLLLDRIERIGRLTYGYFHDFAFLDASTTLIGTEPLGEQHCQFALFEISS